MKAIIMAGGEGSRLRPLTCARPKPMVRLLDRPVLEYTLALLKRYQITEIGITARYLYDEIIDYFGDGSDFGVSISYFIEHAPLGTAGSVKNALSFLDDTFLVISGDALTDIDLSDAIDFHKKNTALATIVLKHFDVPLEYGVVVTDKKGEITRFIEKPGWGEVISDTINTGIYILEPKIFDSISDISVCDFSSELFPRLVHEKKPIYGYVASGYWCDIGDIFAYMSCQNDMLIGNADIVTHSKQLSDKIYIGENVSVEPGANLSAPLYIGDNVHIGEGAHISEGCVIESGAHIGKFANIKKSIVGAHSHIGDFSQLRACIIGEKAILKNSVCAYEQSVIGDMCHIGEGCIIKPSIKIWPQKTIESHCRVNTNLVWEKTYKKSLFDDGKICGEIGVEFTPEFVSRIASSFGTLLNKGKIAVSSSGNADSKMLHKAVISALMSVGCNVYDCKTQLCSITRYALQREDLDGAIHINTSSESNDKNAKVFLIDSNGCDINLKQQRKLENIYHRQDCLRAKSNNIKDVSSLKNYEKLYLQNIIASSNAKKIRGKILINTQNNEVTNILSNAISILGGELEVTTKKIISASSESMRALAKRVKKEGFLCGAAIDNDAESLILIDENGRILDKSGVLAINTIMAIQNEFEKCIVIPISAPTFLSRVAKKFGKEVLYTRTENTNFMNAVVENGSALQFTLNFDAAGCLITLLLYLCKTNKTLSQLSKQIEKYFLTYDRVDCPAEQKGHIIKKLTQQFENYNVDLTDGIKIYDDRGWVLVTPETVSSGVKVTSEGVNIEAANELCAEIIDKINKIKKML